MQGDTNEVKLNIKLLSTLAVAFLMSGCATHRLATRDSFVQVLKTVDKGISVAQQLAGEAVTVQEKLLNKCWQKRRAAPGAPHGGRPRDGGVDMGWKTICKRCISVGKHLACENCCKHLAFASISKSYPTLIMQKTVGKLLTSVFSNY